MEDNIDVEKELEKKNQELFINKMIIDLENAMDSLLMFYSNYCDSVSNEVINTTNSYFDNKNAESFEMISNLVTSFFSMLKDDLNKIIKERLDVIKSNIQKIDSLNYEKKLSSESLIIVNKFSDFYQNNVYMLISELEENIKEHRLDFKDYLLNGLYLKLINTLKDKLMYSIKLIGNNYDENTLMLQTINEKTLHKSKNSDL